MCLSGAFRCYYLLVNINALPFLLLYYPLIEILKFKEIEMDAYELEKFIHSVSRMNNPFADYIIF